MFLSYKTALSIKTNQSAIQLRSYFICQRPFGSRPPQWQVNYRVATTALAHNNFIQVQKSYVGIPVCNAQGSTLTKPNGSLERILRIHLVSTSNMCSVVLCVMTLNLKTSLIPTFSWNLRCSLNNTAIDVYVLDLISRMLLLQDLFIDWSVFFIQPVWAVFVYLQQLVSFTQRLIINYSILLSYLKMTEESY